MKNLIIALIVMLGAASCTSTKSLSKTKQQAIIDAYNKAAVKATADQDDDHVAEFLSAMPESGAVGWSRAKDLVLIDGKPLVDPATGKLVYHEREAIGKSNSMRDLGPGLKRGVVVLGGLPVDPTTWTIDPDAPFQGAFYLVEGDSTSATLNADFAQVWATASVKEKQAAADAVAKALEARKNLLVEVITATGEQARGILKEVKKATPLGAGVAAVEVLVERNGVTEEATVVEKITGLVE